MQDLIHHFDHGIEYDSIEYVNIQSCVLTPSTFIPCIFLQFLPFLISFYLRWSILLSGLFGFYHCRSSIESPSGSFISALFVFPHENMLNVFFPFSYTWMQVAGQLSAASMLQLISSTSPSSFLPTFFEPFKNDQKFH